MGGSDQTRILDALSGIVDRSTRLLVLIAWAVLIVVVLVWLSFLIGQFVDPQAIKETKLVLNPYREFIDVRTGLPGPDLMSTEVPRIGVDRLLHLPWGETVGAIALAIFALCLAWAIRWVLTGSLPAPMERGILTARGVNSSFVKIAAWQLLGFAAWFGGLLIASIAVHFIRLALK